eukprot:GDKI01006733.1.p1 GENE.GDKI01006733.1~~GDKI01006733.1.p1  ORF type:complete len:105 (-),score=35.86 GDKI01006733.1:214-528(-)
MAHSMIEDDAPRLGKFLQVLWSVPMFRTHYTSIRQLAERANTHILLAMEACEWNVCVSPEQLQEKYTHVSAEIGGCLRGLLESPSGSFVCDCNRPLLLELLETL